MPSRAAPKQEAPAVQVYHSLSEVPRDSWNGLLHRHSRTHSCEFWNIVGKADLGSFRCSYALFSDADGRPAGLASFYVISTDLAIFATGLLKRVINALRRRFPGFLMLRMLECGTPVILNSPPFVANGALPQRALVEALDRTLMKAARAKKTSIIVVRDFEPNAKDIEPEFSRLGYALVDSLPNTYMDIVWSTPQEYVASMRSYFRSKLLKHLAVNEKLGIRHELTEDFAGLADTLCAHWLVVHDNASEFQREVLTPDFYREFSRDPHSLAVLFYQGDELIGHVLLYQDGELMRWLYFGRKASVNDSLYIYACHKVIETAIIAGARRLELGLTTYPVKLDLGARPTPIRLALKSPYAIVNPLIRLLYPVLNHVPEVTGRPVFKEPCEPPKKRHHPGQDNRKNPARTPRPDEKRKEL